MVSQIRKNCFYAVWGLALILAFLTLWQGNVSAAEKQATGRVRIVDEAGALAETEAAALKKSAKKLAKKSKWGIVLATCQNLNGRKAKAVCKKNFKKYGKRDNGVSCLVDLDNQEAYFVIFGDAKQYISKRRKKSILSAVKQALNPWDCKPGLDLMVEELDYAFELKAQKDEGNSYSGEESGNLPEEETEAAGSGTARVLDDAGVLMEEEADWLKEVAEKLAQKSGWGVVLATCQDADGKTARTVCEEYFNEYGGGDDGVSCLVDLDNREIYIATAGEAIRCISDRRIEEILDSAYVAVSRQDYAQCLYLMTLGAKNAYEAEVSKKAGGDHIEVGLMDYYHPLTDEELLGSFLVAFLVGVIVYLVIVGKYRLSMNFEKGDSFQASSSIKLKVERDQLVNQYVTKTYIPPDPPEPDPPRPAPPRREPYRATISRPSTNRSSNRSTTHTGAGGRTFGGGGRKF